MKRTITHHVNKEKEGLYYTLDFNVPENVQSFKITYSYSKKSNTSSRNIIDFGLINADGMFIGWSGSAKSTICISETSSTNGYISETIKPGKWQIIVGAYKVCSFGIDVLYEIAFEENKPKTYFGDFHMHSIASDGKYDIFELGKKAKRKHLDFIAVSDHNNYIQNLSLPVIPGLEFIPSVEWTHYKGHMNFFGAVNPFINSFIANSEDEKDTIIENAKKQGAVTSANHPKCRVCPYLWDSKKFDLIEIWNGPMRPANLRAIRWWTSLLNQGYKIPIVGGSDFHNPHSLIRLGNPVTAVNAKSLKTKDILTSVTKGNAYITSSVNGPKLDMKYKEYTFGDTACLNENGRLEITVSNLCGTHIVLVTNKGEKAYKKAKQISINLSEEYNTITFAYIKAVHKILGLEIVRAISNPIYFIA